MFVFHILASIYVVRKIRASIAEGEQLEKPIITPCSAIGKTLATKNSHHLCKGNKRKTSRFYKASTYLIESSISSTFCSVTCSNIIVLNLLSYYVMKLRGIRGKERLFM